MKNGPKEELSGTFNAAACSCKESNVLPARDFEFHTGISGISAHYVLPRGLSDNAYQDHVMTLTRSFRQYYDAQDRKIADPDPALLRRVQREWDAAVALNPDLKKVDMDRNDFLDLRECLMGVASQFNTDDINIFLKARELGRPDRARAIPEAYGLADLMEKINYTTWQTSKTQMYWVPAPQTLKKIKAALEAKMGKPLASSPPVRRGEFRP